MKPQRIPQTDSIEELAHFWDSHCVTDVEDELEEVTGPVFERSDHVVHVHLSPQEAAVARKLALSEGVGDVNRLVQRWVTEKLASR